LASLDLPRYEELVLRAVGTVLAPVCGIFESQFAEYFRVHASLHEFDRYTAPALPGTARPKLVKIKLPARAEVVGEPLLV
jgi:hypothetical protein